MLIYTVAVLFDLALGFKPHVNIALSKISKAFISLGKQKKFFTSTALKSLYYSMFQSYLIYYVQFRAALHQNRWLIYSVNKMQQSESYMFRIPVRECARTQWMGTPSWEKGGRIPKVGTRSVSWAQTKEEGRRDRMRRRQEVKEDDPFMASRCQHAQSKLVCIAWEETGECSDDIVFVVLTVIIVSGKKISWCQYHLYSSSDVRSRVGNNTQSYI